MLHSFKSSIALACTSFLLALTPISSAVAGEWLVASFSKGSLVFKLSTEYRCTNYKVIKKVSELYQEGFFGSVPVEVYKDILEKLHKAKVSERDPSDPKSKMEHFDGCWVMNPNGEPWLVTEDGRHGNVPVTDFSVEKDL